MMVRWLIDMNGFHGTQLLFRVSDSPESFSRSTLLYHATSVLVHRRWTDRILFIVYAYRWSSATIEKPP
jgi:hypothetical protein